MSWLIASLKGPFWSAAGSASYRVLMMLALWSAARHLGSENFGRLGAAQNTLVLFSTLASAGLGMTATRHVAEYLLLHPARLGPLIRLLLCTSLLTGAVAGMGLHGLSDWLGMALFGTTEMGSDLRWIAVSVFALSVDGPATGILAGFSGFRILAMNAIARGILLCALMTFGTRWLGLEGALGAMAICDSIAAALSMSQVLLQLRVRTIPLFSGSLLPELSLLHRFALPAFLSQQSLVLCQWITLGWIATREGTFSGIGHLNVGLQWRSALMFLPASLGAGLLPLLSRAVFHADPGAFRRVARLNMAANLLITLLPAGLIAWAAPGILHLYGPAFSGGTNVLVWCALSAIPGAIAHALTYEMLAVGRISTFATIYGCGAVTHLGCVFAYSDRQGVAAYAAAMFVSSGAMSLAAMAAKTHSRRVSENSSGETLSNPESSLRQAA